jgi:hypothetical protein
VNPVFDYAQIVYGANSQKAVRPTAISDSILLISGVETRQGTLIMAKHILNSFVLVEVKQIR